MNDNKGDYLDDPSWAGLFEMAKEYEEQDDFNILESVIEIDKNYINHETKAKSYSSPEEALKAVFGYTTFREGQKQIIEAILAGKDAFVVMPTGAGKSLCYQILKR